MQGVDFSNATLRELLTLYSRTMEQLREREIVRSGNNPVADYCESLVVKALNLTRKERSNKGCDAVDDAARKRYEIKCRRITKYNPSTLLSPFRDLDSCHFDYLVGVLFDEDFTVTRACRVPHKVVLDSAVYREHVHGWLLHLNPRLWDKPGVRDITSELTKTQNEWV